MIRKRIVKIAGPSLLLLGSVMLFGAMRDHVATSAADASPSHEQSAGDLPEIGQVSKGPLFNRSANEQRATQTRILEQILDELRATRQLLANGNARVRVESVAIDYDRLSELIQGVHSSGGGAADATIQEEAEATPAPAGSGSGSIRRISSAGSDQVNTAR